MMISGSSCVRDYSQVLSKEKTGRNISVFVTEPDYSVFGESHK